MKPHHSIVQSLAVRGSGGRPRRPPGLRLAQARAPLVLALVVLALLLAAYGLASPSAPDAAPPRAAAGAGFTDVRLYRDQVAFARAPSTYYARVTDEQRRMRYPLRPFVTVRPPALAFVLAWLPGGELAGRVLLGALAATACAAWSVRLVKPLGAPGAAAAGLGLAGGVVAAFTPNGYLMHECWAGLLIALSLALYPGERRAGRAALLPASLAAALAAALVRELALPFLGVMALMALLDRRPREALLWVGAIGLALLALLAHALAVLRHTLPTDPGMDWVRLGGWGFVLSTNRWNALMALAPWLAAALIPAGLAGSLAWAGPVGRRLWLTLLGYAAAFLVVGRPENTYWGLMIAPLLPLGWAGAAAAVLGVMGTPVRALLPAGPSMRRRRGWGRRSLPATGSGRLGRRR